MATIIGLPKLSPTMEEGVLAKWRKKEGDKVSPGDIIAEVETDKANMDFTLEDEGTLLKLLVKEGDPVKLGGPVAILGNPGEDTAGLEKTAREQIEKPGTGGVGEAAEVSKPAPKAATPTPTPTPPPSPAPAPTPPPSPNGGAGRILASPLAKTIAAERGIDLRTIRGTGPGGRIVERDVLQSQSPVGGAPQAQVAMVTTKASSPAAAVEGLDFTDKPLSMMRKTIAKRLVEAKSTIPHFYLTTDCDAGPLTAFRTQLNAIAGEDVKISVNDLIVKAMAIALRRVPSVNASFLGDKIRTFHRVHIGVAVAVEDGLITPVVRDTDRKGLALISLETKDLATRARAKKLSPEEMTGGTATVSNLGMYGIDHFEAIINPPEGVILAVGAVKQQPVVQGGELAVGLRMALTLSCDHRVVDGALGARFLAELTKILEQPQALAL